MDHLHDSLTSNSKDDSGNITTEAIVHNEDLQSTYDDNSLDFEEVTMDDLVVYPRDENSNVFENDDGCHHISDNVKKLMDLHSDDESDVEKYIIPEILNSSNVPQLSQTTKKSCFAILEPHEYLKLKKDCHKSDLDSDSEIHQEKNKSDSVHHEQSEHDTEVHHGQSEPNALHDSEFNEASDASYLWDTDESIEQVRDHESSNSYKSRAPAFSPPIKRHENKFHGKNYDFNHSKKTKKLLPKRSSKQNKVYADSSDSECSNQLQDSVTKRMKRKRLPYNESKKVTKSRSTSLATGQRSGEQSPRERKSRYKAIKDYSESDESSSECNVAKRPRKGKTVKRPASHPTARSRRDKTDSDLSDDDQDKSEGDEGSSDDYIYIAKRSRKGGRKFSRNSSKNTIGETGKRSPSRPTARSWRGPEKTESDLSDDQDESEYDESSFHDNRISKRRSRSKIRKPLAEKKIYRENKKVRRVKFSDPEYSASTSPQDESDSSASVDDVDSDSAEENNSQRKSSKRHSYDKAGKVDKDSLKHMFKFVAHSSEGGKHYYKKNVCPYCRKKFSRLDVHLLAKRNGHRDMRTVKKILEYQVGDPKRRYLFGLLKNYGNAQYNRNHKLNPKGEIISTRRIAINKGRPLEHKPHLLKNNAKANENSDNTLPNTSSRTDKPLAEKALVMAQKRLAGDINANNQQPFKIERKECSICKAVVANLRAHYKNMHETDETKMTLKGITIESRRTMKLWHNAASSRLSNHVLPRLNDDKYAFIAKYDYLIILYGNKFAEKYQHDDQVDLIKGHMRLLAKLLFEARKHSKHITDLASCFNNKGWGPILKAAKTLSGYTEDCRELKNAYNGLTLGMLIKRCIIRLKRVYCGPEYAVKREELADFLSAFEDDYSSIIISKATATINRCRRKALSNELPTDEDFAKLSFYVQEKNLLCLKSLKEKGYNEEDYVNLINTTACKLEVFNKRRNLEIQRAELEDYQCRMIISQDSEEFKQLSEVDQEQVRNYASLLFVQGKKTTGIDGAIYLTHEDEESIDLIIKNRPKAGISKDSVFLFSLPPTRRGIQKHVSCYHALVNISKECGAKNPDALRATLLRKYATKKYSQMNNTKRTDKFYLHMAHTEKTSNKFYNKLSLKDVVEVTNTLEHMHRAPVKNALEKIDQASVKSNHIIEESNEETCEDNFQIEIEATVAPSRKSKTRLSWNSAELNDLYRAFPMQLDKGVYPSKKEVNDALKSYPLLKQRGADGIRSKVQHIFKKSKIV